MFCKNCGTEVTNDAKFCPVCGSAVVNAQPEAQPEAEPINEPTYTNNVSEYPAHTPILVWGIIGLAFACTFIFSVLGIIFSSIAKNKANSYINSGAPHSTQVTVGRNLSTAGVIVGIILSILCTIYFIVLFALIALAIL